MALSNSSLTGWVSLLWQVHAARQGAAKPQKRKQAHQFELDCIEQHRGAERQNFEALCDRNTQSLLLRLH